MPPRIRTVLLLLACGIPLDAQSWDALNSLKPGDPLEVVDSGGTGQRGLFAAVSTSALTLETKKGAISLDKSRVRKVQVRSRARRLRNILIGVGIGVVIGVVIDETLGVRLRNEGTESARALTYIAPIGLIGGLCALPAYRTIYRAP